MFVPVSFRKVRNMGNCMRNAAPVKRSMMHESMSRSVTTVPNDLVKEMPSNFLSVPQRVTSPTRGKSRLAA